MIIKWQSRNITMHKFITPRVGSDGYFPVCVGGSREFQSTLPVWGATSDRPVLHAPQRISIHAPRVGSDSTLVCSYPHEEEFQSTLPVWGATRITFDGLQLPPDFNPRSPCGERPQSSATSKCEQRHFNPRSPCGERLKPVIPPCGVSLYFNPRSPCGERRKTRGRACRA